MTTATAPSTAAERKSDRPVYKVTFTKVLRSEWGKFLSLRSSLIALGLAQVLLLAVGLIAAAVYTPGGEGGQPEIEDGAVGLALTGVTFAELALGVLGVLIAAGEYSSGTIRSTLAAVPKRLPVLWAKVLFFGVIAQGAAMGGILMTFQIGEMILKDDALAMSLTDDGVLRSLVGASLYLGLVGVWGVALGTLLRSTAGGIAVLVGILLVLPGLAGLLPESIRDDVTPYLPNNAGQAVMHLHQASDSLAPWAGLAVFAGWVALTLAGAAYRLARTDA
ncbi:ABC transporter permease [Streptomyces sp. NPDC002680]|uniref:ABC transporter permease n=1 Tax=Streptomyces sp. NPDC002680 TaxID=3364659 RepID=UPI0036C30C8B